MAYLKMAAGDKDAKSFFLEIMNRPNRYIARDALTQTTISFSALRDFYKDKTGCATGLPHWKHIFGFFPL